MGWIFKDFALLVVGSGFLFLPLALYVPNRGLVIVAGLSCIVGGYVVAAYYHKRKHSCTPFNLGHWASSAHNFLYRLLVYQGITVGDSFTWYCGIHLTSFRITTYFLEKKIRRAEMLVFCF